MTDTKRNSVLLSTTVRYINTCTKSGSSLIPFVKQIYVVLLLRKHTADASTNFLRMDEAQMLLICGGLLDVDKKLSYRFCKCNLFRFVNREFVQEFRAHDGP